MDWGIVLGIIGVVGIPLAVGLTMAVTSRGEFRFVRGCFILAAILMISSGLLLHSVNELPLWIRVLIAGCIGAAALGGLTVALDWVGNKEKTANKSVKPEDPILVQGFLPAIDYVAGTNVGRIAWKDGYSHAQLMITNPTSENYTDLDVVIQPEMPIIAAKAHADFSVCRLGPIGKPSSPLVIGTTPSGAKIGMPAENPEEDILIGPPYRLFCEKLPSKAQILIDLATVDPDHDVMSAAMWKKDRHDPSFIDVRSIFTASNERHRDDSRLSFHKKSE